jgi:hypothetical protein
MLAQLLALAAAAAMSVASAADAPLVPVALYYESQ